MKANPQGGRDASRGYSAMSYEQVQVEKRDGIATITLDRPERLNALTPLMRVEIRQAFKDAAADAAVRTLVLTGAGRGFCSGADVQTVAERTEMADDEPERARLLQPVATPRVLAVMRGLNKPIICALNGVAAGAGTGLALSCDVIVASDRARFRVAFTRMGLPPSDGLSYILPRMIGTHRTLELAFTNDVIDAGEMERIGLVNRVVPHDELMAAVREMAGKMALIPPLTLALARQCIYRGVAAPDIESQLLFEGLAGRTLAQTEDQREAQRSFIEKREPVYRGR